MARRNMEVLLNAAFWLLSGWMIVSSFSVVRQEVEVLDGGSTVHVEHSGPLVRGLLLLLAVALPLFYLNLRNMLREGATKGGVAFRGLLLLGAALGLYALLARAPAPALTGGLPVPAGLAVGVLLFYFAISCAYGAGKAWLRSEDRRQRETLEKQRAELALLRQQLRPHFLFNVLNGLLAMTDREKDGRLTVAIEGLSGLLRHVVDGAGREAVPLEEELAFLRNYADLQLLRHAPGEVEFTLEVQGGELQRPVESGIFLPLVENAFLHGTLPGKHARIAADLDLRSAGELRFRISNPVFPGQGMAGAGTGLPALRRRLQLVYPGAHALTVANGSTYRAELIIHDHARCAGG